MCNEPATTFVRLFLFAVTKIFESHLYWTCWMWCDRMQFVQTSQSDRLMLVTSLLSQLPWYFSWKIQCSRRQNHRHLTTYFRLVVDMARELSKNIPNFQLKCGAHDTKCKDYSNRDIRSAIEKVKSQLLIKNVSGHITGSQFAFQAIECPTVHGSILFNLYGSILTSSPTIADQNQRKKITDTSPESSFS